MSPWILRDVVCDLVHGCWSLLFAAVDFCARLYWHGFLPGGKASFTNISMHRYMAPNHLEGSRIRWVPRFNLPPHSVSFKTILAGNNQNCVGSKETYLVIHIGNIWWCVQIHVKQTHPCYPCVCVTICPANLAGIMSFTMYVSMTYIWLWYKLIDIIINSIIIFPSSPWWLVIQGVCSRSLNC